MHSMGFVVLVWILRTRNTSLFTIYFSNFFTPRSIVELDFLLACQEPTEIHLLIFLLISNLVVRTN